MTRGRKERSARVPARQLHCGRQADLSRSEIILRSSGHTYESRSPCVVG